MSLARLPLLCLALCSLVFESSACGRGGGGGGGRGGGGDRNKPVLTCPSNIHQIADPIQVNAKVTWKEPNPYDNEEKRYVGFTRNGLGPGKLFSEGTRTITYSAKDNSGNQASCSFKITVTIVRCPRWGTPSDGWRICHPGTDMRYGGICRFGCYPGHELVGSDRTQCRADKTWTVANQPYCEKTTCDPLFPTSDQLNVVSITCTDSNNYRSKCTFRCTDGYSVRPGYSKVRVCGVHGDWIGTTPECIDVRPPVFDNCPLVKTAYAERTKTSGRVIWDDPGATDNSGSVTIQQTLGPTSYSELAVGEYDVEYVATDGTGNSATCRFKLIVKQILCPVIFPLPYTSVLCPSGRIYGSSCNFTCEDGTVSNYPMLSYCEKQGSKYYYGLWDFGNYQPYCEHQNNCPDLRPPDYGALTCDTWMGGRYCHMMCQDGYTVDYDKGLVVCNNKGQWLRDGDIPNCEAAVVRRGVLVINDIPYGHYNGSCQEAKEEIQQNFIEILRRKGFCTESECSADDVKVICGGTHKRETETTVKVQLTVRLSPELSYAEIISRREEFKAFLAYEHAIGGLDISVTGLVLQAGTPLTGMPGVICPEGAVPDTKQSLTCVTCSPGFYQDTTFEPNVCRKCDIGSYQTDFGQATCHPCPPGMTTETEGATECKEACPKGQDSPKGTTPCSPCDIGRYSDTEGARECTLCPGSTTTNTTGSISEEACYEFDVLFTGSETEDFEAPSVSANMTAVDEFSVAMWLKCSSCLEMLNITDETGAEFLTIKGQPDLVETAIGSTILPATTLTLSASYWRYLYVSWSTQSVAVHIDGDMITSGDHTEILPQTLNFKFGGTGFIGSISQLNVYSFVVPELQDTPDTCFNIADGDLVSWRDFATLDGSFVQTRSKCDAFDNCVSSPCQNDGVCSDDIGGFSCTCLDGFTGSDCSINIDDCEVGFCDNDGTCVDGVDSYTCSCTEGFSGEFCEIQIVDGGWGEYGNWSLCSVTCGVGQQERYRTCGNPEPSNGGKECEGSSSEVKSCTENECVYECDQDPEPPRHGSCNCEWEETEDGRTRRCYPACDEGYEFDSTLFVIPSNVKCGMETGFLWNINNTDNPFNKLPNCKEISKAQTNILYYNYSSDCEDESKVDSTVCSDIKNRLTSRAKQTVCVSELGRCEVTDVSDYSSSRKKRSTPKIQFTITVTCNLQTDIDECYNLLASVVYELNNFTSDLGYSANSTSVDGIAVCDSGYIPVLQYCIPCGEGMYQDGDYCERCRQGFYQDESAQRSCKQCPYGWTTAGLQSSNLTECNVEVPDETDTTQIVLIVCVAVTATAVIILSIIVVVICKTKKNGKRRATTPIHVDEATQHGDFNRNVRFQQRPMTPYNLFVVPTPQPLYSSKKKAAMGVEESDIDAGPPPSKSDSASDDKDAGQFNNPLYDSD